MLSLKNQTLLVLAPHPDDEVLGCGGLITKIKNQGGKVYVLYLTVGDTDDISAIGRTNATQRIKEIKKVVKFLKIDGFRVAFPGNQYHLKLDAISQSKIIREIESHQKLSLKTVKPTMLATTQSSDYNQDHRACYQAAITATRPAPHPDKPFQKYILGYEFAGSVSWGVHTPKHPNFFVPLTPMELETKIKAMRLYSSQTRESPHTRSEENIRYLAHLRGTQCGINLAEAYYAYRIFLS